MELVRIRTSRIRWARARSSQRIGRAHWRGSNTIQQYVRAGLVDELHFAISSVLIGTGERLFEGIDLRSLGYEVVQFVASEKATHVVIKRPEPGDA